MLGGIQKIVRSYCRFLTDAVSRKMFTNSILADIFFVKERKAYDLEGERRNALSTNELVSLATEVDPNKKITTS